jgi:hypothetical protein
MNNPEITQLLAMTRDELRAHCQKMNQQSDDSLGEKTCYFLLEDMDAGIAKQQEQGWLIRSLDDVFVIPEVHIYGVHFHDQNWKFVGEDLGDGRGLVKK